MQNLRTDNLARGAYCDMAALLRERFHARDLNLFARRPVSSVQSGRFRTRFRGRGVDFEEVRLYQPGDDIRSIDWRVTARTQVPHTKLYSEERERPVYLLVDQRSPMFFGSVNAFKSTLACHIGAALAWSALGTGDRLGSLVFGNEDFRDVRPKRSKHAVLQTLQWLEKYNRSLDSPTATPALSLAQMLKDTRRISAPGAALFVISDFHDLDADAEKQLFHLRRHLDITLMQVYDPLERALAANSSLTVTDGQHTQPLPANSKHFQAAYRAQAQAQQDALEARLQRLALELLPFSTADDHIQLLRQLFATRSKKVRQRV